MIMKNTKIKMNKNQKGQTLLFVIVAVTIAMAVGVAVSTRTIQSLKRVARTDTSARVIAAAEGGIENLLGRNYSQLDGAVYDGVNSVDCESIGATPGPEAGTCSYVFSSIPTELGASTPDCVCTCEYCTYLADKCESGSGSLGADTCGVNMKTCTANVSCDELSEKSCISDKKGEFTGCPITIPDERETNTGDLISSRAVVKVETYNSNEPGGYAFNLSPGEVKEVYIGPDYMTEYDSALICWDDSGNDDDNAAIYYYSYNQDGVTLKGGLRPADVDFSYGSNLSSLFIEENNDRNPYEFCSTIELVDNAYGLRIKVLFNETRVAISPAGPMVELPPQGYKLTSRGEIVTGSGSEEKATVIVHKSLPYAPDIFDYGIYTPATLSGSN